MENPPQSRLRLSLLCAVLCHLPVAAWSDTWFGPAFVSFETNFPGNPYDGLANDVRVVFASPDGGREERLAYFDGGRWNAWLTARAPGDYQATLVRNGSNVTSAPHPVTVRTPITGGGFVRVAGTRFRTDDGAPYYPLGFNLCWQQPDCPPLTQHLQRLRDLGVNWTRIWACSWDGKNPFYSEHQKPPLGELLPSALQRWDEIVAAAEAGGVRFQFVLFHHGLFSTGANANWSRHAWNKANGGFLARPQDFFTDATAREYTRRWLRHAVARWGHSPAIMAWELFNEVEWTDAANRDRNWPVIVAWHNEMAAYVRQLDPYHHLVTTSAAQKNPELYAGMDYFQPHAYPANVFRELYALKLLPGKPGFFGEFGRGIEKLNDDERGVVRDGLWAGLLAGHAGTGQYWFWDRVVQLKLEDEFQRAARMVTLSRMPERTNAQPQAVTLSGAAGTVHAVGDGDFALARLLTAKEQPLPARAGLRLAGLKDGPCRVYLMDLRTGAERELPGALQAGLLADLPIESPDTAVLVLPSPPAEPN